MLDVGIGIQAGEMWRVRALNGLSGHWKGQLIGWKCGWSSVGSLTRTATPMMGGCMRAISYGSREIPFRMR